MIGNKDVLIFWPDIHWKGRCVTDVCNLSLQTPRSCTWLLDCVCWNCIRKGTQTLTQVLTPPTPAWLRSSSSLCWEWYVHTHTHTGRIIVRPWVKFKHVPKHTWTFSEVFDGLSAGIWERKHGLLDRFLSDPHPGHSPPQHTALLHGPVEVR